MMIIEIEGDAVCLRATPRCVAEQAIRPHPDDIVSLYRIKHRDRGGRSTPKFDRRRSERFKISSARRQPGKRLGHTVGLSGNRIDNHDPLTGVAQTLDRPPRSFDKAGRSPMIRVEARDPDHRPDLWPLGEVAKSLFIEAGAILVGATIIQRRRATGKGELLDGDAT